MSSSHSDVAPLESIVYRGVDKPFQLLDQRQLPHTLVYDTVETIEDVFNAIKEMRVRGAPAIAVTAALGVAVASYKQAPESVASLADAAKFLLQSLDRVAESRPTAVNLFNAVRDLKTFVETAQVTIPPPSGPELLTAYKNEAERLFNDDTDMNTKLMKHGADFVLDPANGIVSGDAEEKVNVVTICNTGSLATSKFGTALGVVRELHYRGRLGQLYALETRPWNQGARLTVFEAAHEKIPVTLIVDSAVSFLMKTKKIHFCVVGADRICANGDTANKVGTYQVAVAAKHHSVPFFVAAPTTTLDPRTADGSTVPIEEREATEITHNMVTKQRIVAEGETVNIWNPVFDITPGEIVTGGVITEDGVRTPAKEAPHYHFTL